MLNTLAAKETEVKVHTLSELRGMEMLDTSSDKVTVNEVESLGDKQVKVNAKSLYYY